MNESTTSSEKSFVEGTEQKNDFFSITERFITNPEEVLSTKELTVAFLTEWLASSCVSKSERKQILALMLQKAMTNHKELVTSLQWIITQQKVTLTRDFLISCYHAHIANDPSTEHLSSIKAHALWHPRMPISLVVNQANLKDAKESMIGQIGMIKKPWQSLAYAKNYMKRAGLSSNEAVPEHMVWKIMNWDNWMKDAVVSAR